MTLSRADAIDEIIEPFHLAWAPRPVKYDNVAKDDVPPPADPDPDNDVSWARFVLRHGASGQATLANFQGQRRWRRTGGIVVQLFTIKGEGLSGSPDLPTLVQNVYEGLATPGAVWFRDVSVNEIGPDGNWFQTNVVAFFEYDEIK